MCDDYFEKHGKCRQYPTLHMINKRYGVLVDEHFDFNSKFDLKEDGLYSDTLKIATLDEALDFIIFLKERMCLNSV